ncbi:MAG: UDP-3-O-acyl-N-acetylglucosamine deacetylase [Actinobacteria bacterium]|nr:UDP-3-O-acyl-N-acetylglucosamine deacetylase [Actinomycetota bacterium]
MSDRALRWTSRVLLGIAVALVGLSLSVDILAGRSFGELIRNFSLFGYVMATTFPAVGAVIVHHRPRHPVGWIYVAIGTGMLSGLAHQYAEWGLSDPADPAPLAILASWIGGWAWIVSIGLFLTFALLLFPDGHLPSRRWRPVAAAAAAGIVLQALDFAIGAWTIRGIQVVESGDASVASGLPDPLATIGSALLFTTAILSVGSLFVRLRRADAEQRQQIRWVVFAGAVAVTTMVLNIVLGPNDDDSGNWAMIVAAPLIPVATGVAIARFRLYDFDLVLNRTVLFGLLASFITAVYIGIVVGVGLLTGSRADDPNVGLSLLATAVVAAAFQPARQRARRIANRLVYGHRATPYEVMADFSARMAETVSTDEVLPRMAEAAARGVGAGSVTVTVDLPTGGHRTATWPPASDASSGPDHVVLVEHQGERAGTIAVRMRPGERLDADDVDLLEQVLAGVADVQGPRAPEVEGEAVGVAKAVGPDLIPPRLAHEFATHKALDLIGDLALLGRPVVARFVAWRTGHAENRALGRKLQGIGKAVPAP